MDAQRELVSVIIPIYNMEKHLERCVQSVLRQTHTNLEILLIDDGSQDDSLEIMNRYKAQDARVRVFHKENRGVSSARNLGMEMMTGEYFTFIDPDDFVAEQYIEWLYHAMRKTNASLTICNTQLVFGTEPNLSSNLSDGPTVMGIPIEQYTLWHEASHAVCGGALYETKKFDNLRFNEALSIGEDTLFFFEALCKCSKIAFIKERPYYYVQHSMSATKGMYTPKRWSEFQAWCEICKLTPNMPRALQQSVKAWYVMTCAKILTLMRYSKYHDVQREKYLLHIMRTNVMAIWLIPNNKWQKKIRLLAYTVCPNIIGSIQWKYYQSKGMVNDQ